ncbi:phospholipase D-like domain-containing protein [Acidihalobacter ferrooxydans]|uniref:PLD phosphodiesterase domain-containing protein n=1 Tax=Acidihalobacter ferrooxydans TaxID=1765967 RepID=A0A1P8UG15_9GAMM|nr:phospholipase D-like domain-containing protein [Acidihalobacter ferrooxydans]APZ42798.1 hypothetical protein BW247_06585 [Acidihalobacter ferrooxydans]
MALQYPLRPANRFRLLADGDRFIPEMLAAIAGAQHYVFIETYLCESGQLMGRIIDALETACRRAVSVCMMLDDFGALHLHQSDRERLLHAGVHLHFYNPLRFGPLHRNLHRNHRKLLTVDGRLAFTGGAGLTDDFDPQARPQDWWHDIVVAVEGPCVNDLQHSFVRIWRRSGGDATQLPRLIPALPHEPGGSARLLLHESGRREILGELFERIRHARQRVLIHVAYFVPPHALLVALRRAARRGVAVHLILPGTKTDHGSARFAGRRHYGRLLRAGVRIHEYTPRFTHTKLTICDDWVCLGSANLDHWTLRWNLEANLGIEDTDCLDAALRTFRDDLSQTDEIILRKWRERSRWERLRERFWGEVSVWLARRSYRLGLRDPRRYPAFQRRS